MKIFHTADWHLGKLVKEVYMTEDQRYVLDQFVSAAREEKPDVIIIAGDLYDRSVPPHDAVALFHDILTELVVKLKIPVLAIAGNHDSPERIHFAHSIMEKQGLHMRGKITTEMQPIVLDDEHGPVHFHLVPFADPGQVRHLFDEAEGPIRTHDDAMRAIIGRLKQTMDPTARHVFVGHAFVTPTGGQGEHICDSERPLSIGGADTVSAEYFADFHYTALGHLHQAHYVRNETIQYAGSPLKYSISEENHRKGFHIVHLDQTGQIEVERRMLQPRRDLRTVTATIDELKEHPRSDDYVFVSLLDEQVVLFPMEQIRAVYPNAMHVSRAVTHLPSASTTSSVERKNMDPFTLFQSFAEEMIGKEPPAEMEELFKEILQEVWKEEEERA
ncbi:exonuclease sbcCD subunit D [Ammoniphilus oxalaticus]|uniref:Nuclease SbcCD subunit D n=1 Tax=Ammoniphilus oxalaticus TaxID=66863 RepID=A0A419SKE1_9BACL|nr:exonuclease SbcCD subunit D [Ammoniphilus oxalaticus]RKD24504.1 exonuclease sbcCD subunit D [Ammoniphilus oxalaticus]